VNLRRCGRLIKGPEKPEGRGWLFFRSFASFRSFPLLLILLCSGLAAPPQRPVQSDEFRKHLWHLASDELNGRGNNRPEIDQAANYIADWFRRYGLAPAGDNRTYFQEFEARTEVQLGPGTGLAVELPEGKHALNLHTDYEALFSGPLPVSAPLAFAGFGITAAELGYDDYAGLDARGKIVAVFQHEPEEELETSRFAGRSPSSWSTVTYKAANARNHGAAGLLLLPDPHCERERTWKTDTQVEAFGLPVVKLSEEWSRRLLRSGPRTLSEIARAARDVLLEPFDIPNVNVSLSVEAIERYRTLRNVVGLVPGTTDDYVVVGAHYDHLGLGERKALAPENIGAIHNGADDNASGTAGLLFLASRAVRRKNGSGLVFIAFAGEELGLLGSSAYVSRPKIPLEKIRAMLNMDMIGRSDGSVYIGGVGTAAEFHDLLDGLKKETTLELKYAETPQAPSDHLSFAGEKIPVLFFFSGLHADYHQPSDDREKIDQVRARQILQVVESVIRRLVRKDQPVHFVETDTNTALLGAAAGSSVLGLQPEPSWEADGVLVADVKAATPAFEAGFRRGDILIGCDGKAVANRLDLIQQLTEQGRAPETAHQILVVRGEELLALPLSTTE